jgi:hypothetical protein
MDNKNNVDNENKKNKDILLGYFVIDDDEIKRYRENLTNEVLKIKNDSENEIGEINVDIFDEKKEILKKEEKAEPIKENDKEENMNKTDLFEIKQDKKDEKPQLEDEVKEMNNTNEEKKNSIKKKKIIEKKINDKGLKINYIYMFIYLFNNIFILIICNKHSKFINIRITWINY